MERSAPTNLRVVKYERKSWYFDERLGEIRNVANPNDVLRLNSLELEYFRDLINTTAAVRIVWKDEGRDSEGRSHGPAYTENGAGNIVENFGWITWKEADALANQLGLELDEV